MYQQMTIFDFLGPAYPDIKTITEAEAVRIVGDALGARFVWNEFFQEWESVKGKVKLSLNYSHYNLTDNHDLFLGAGYAYRTSSGGRPCDSIKEAIAYLERKVEEVKNDRT